MGGVNAKASPSKTILKAKRRESYDGSRQAQTSTDQDIKITKNFKVFDFLTLLSHVDKVSDSHFSLENNKDRYFNQRQLGEIQEKFPEYKMWMEQSVIYKTKSSKPRTKKIKWKEGEIIGKGSCGNVRLGLNLESGSIMAVKQVELVSKASRIQQDRVEALEVEIELLSKFSHKNIVKYYGSARTQDTLNIFLEYISGGSIASMVKKFGPLNTNIIRSYTKQILEGLEYLHVRNTIHRDIKGANILVDHNGACKLTDFGTATKLYSLMENEDRSKLLQEIKGTLNWMAPECLKQKTLGRQCDIWGVGCTVLEMATGKPPWADIFQKSDAVNSMSLLYKIGKAKSPPPIPDNLDPEMIDFLHHCFKVNPFERPNVSELLNHPFISKQQLEPSPSLPEFSPIMQDQNFESPKITKQNTFPFPSELKENCSVLEYLNKCKSFNDSNASKILSPVANNHHTPIKISLKDQEDDDNDDDFMTPTSKNKCLELFERRPDDVEIENDEKMKDYAHFRMNSLKNNKRSREAVVAKSPRSYKSLLSRQNTPTEESILPPKSMFGMMLMRKKESTDPKFWKDPHKLHTETALPQILEYRYGGNQDEPIPLPNYLFLFKSNSGEAPFPLEENHKPNFPAILDFEQISEEERNSREDLEENLPPNSSDQIQKSLEELEDFNLQDDLQQIYKQIDATEIPLQ